MAIRISGMMSGLDTESLVKELSSAYSARTTKYEKQKKLLEMKQDVWKDVNKSVYSFYTGSLSSARLQSSYKSKEIKSSNTNVADKISGKGEAQIYVQSLATKTFVTGSKVKDEDWPIGQDASFDVKIGGRTETIDITADMTMKDVAKKLYDVGLDANFDEKTGRLFIASRAAGSNSAFTIEGDADLMRKMGLGEEASISLGTDAVAWVNGAMFQQGSNDFDVNGIKFTATGAGEARISEENTSSMKDTIKKLVEDYNTLIKDLDTRYNAASGKGYDPLTEDEEEKMTEKQIEKWNDKITESCLRKDATLGGISSTLYNAFAGGGLSKMGITFQGYFVKDASDRRTLTNDEDKLDKLLNEHGDEAIDIVTKVAQKAYNDLGDKMKSTSMRSAYSVYNDKQMKKDIEQYDKTIAKWETKVQDIEDKYYKQFAAMEKMMAQLQGNSASLSNLFG